MGKTWALVSSSTGFEAGLCNCGTLSLFPIFLIIKPKQEPKLPSVVEKAVPTNLQKRGSCFVGEELNNISVLCDSWGSSPVSSNLSLLVRISYIPDGQSPGYSKNLQFRLWDRGPFLFCLSSSTVEHLVCQLFYNLISPGPA